MELRSVCPNHLVSEDLLSSQVGFGGATTSCLLKSDLLQILNSTKTLMDLFLSFM